MLSPLAAASSMPVHADWLNDRSSTPPTSSTAHAWKGSLSSCSSALASPPLDSSSSGASPQAAAARATTPTTADIRIILFTCPPRPYLTLSHPLVAQIYFAVAEIYRERI